MDDDARASRRFGVHGEVWRVEDDAGALACEVVVDELEDFVLRGRLRRGPAWAALAELLDLLDGPEADGTEWNQVAEEVHDRYTLRYPSGRPVAVFVLLVDGDRAGIRWAD